MIRIGILLGSTRRHRVGDQVAAWVLDVASTRTDATFEIVDLRDHPLPHLGEPDPETRPGHAEQIAAWAERISTFDGFVMITPEYNHAPPAVLKNAIDHLRPQWANRAVGFVSYGGAGGVRAVEHLRLISGELQLADVRQQVALPLATDFPNYPLFAPTPGRTGELTTLVDQLIAWSTALAPLRSAA